MFSIPLPVPHQPQETGTLRTGGPGPLLVLVHTSCPSPRSSPMHPTPFHSHNAPGGGDCHYCHLYLWEDLEIEDISQPASVTQQATRETRLGTQMCPSQHPPTRFPGQPASAGKGGRLTQQKLPRTHIQRPAAMGGPSVGSIPSTVCWLRHP